MGVQASGVLQLVLAIHNTFYGFVMARISLPSPLQVPAHLYVNAPPVPHGTRPCTPPLLSYTTGEMCG
ncbi:hypothetical protein BKA82DRAFT_994207 [Pisolithus tinctorius]|uniref:Uncharacterized protein n=1 Tax=Pisolithus tinctorius Marx 270 TaxID=870435 RepID=A0A0C3PEN7_PISTI|nr:hypothetical protein BKA82DRAFT_994207 [Pisolithus tinctorius]KIO12290.1 hypothetical protein M404DRAFT_994207 [Pisolithus tinctorius Marx 270]